MSEFAEVMRHKARMCKAFLNSEAGCLECGMAQINTGTGESCNDYLMNHPAAAETIITAWAADNPEKKYPSWGRWLRSLGVLDIELVDCLEEESILNLKTFRYYVNDQKIYERIPPDIAERLGLQPIDD